MLKIAYIGNFEPFHSTENHVRKSLEALGHLVLPVQENLYNAEYVYCVATENQCDLVLYTRTWGIANLQEVFDRLHAEGIPTASYHLDLYYGLARHDLYDRLKAKGIDGIYNDPFWHTKYVFTVDGDPQSAEWFKQNNINHFYVKAGVYKGECYIDQQELPLENDIIFVGSYGYHPEWPYRPQLIDWLWETYGSRFKLVPGNGNPAIRNDALNKLYANTKVVVGDTLCPGFTHQNYWSDRIYETLGRGGFIIHPRIVGLEDEFTNKKTAVFYDYNNFSQLKELIDYYLDNTVERETIRAAGHNFVKNKCNYEVRMEQILNKMAEFEPQIRGKI